MSKTWVSLQLLSKAVDTVTRKGLWQILERLGCPRKFLNMVIQLREGQRGQIRLEGDLSKPFLISNGVKQGYVLAPTLFSIFFSMILKHINEDLEDEHGVYVRYGLDGSLFKVTPRLMRGLSGTFSSQMMLPWLPTQNEPCNVSLPASQMLPSSSASRSASKRRRSSISLSPWEVYHPPHITIGETELKSMQQFSYLGCTISSDARIDKEVDNRLAKASEVLGRPYKRVWNNKISVYRAVVLTVLLYGSNSKY